jgi:hypothetical protein
MKTGTIRRFAALLAALATGVALETGASAAQQPPAEWRKAANAVAHVYAGGAIPKAGEAWPKVVEDGQTTYAYHMARRWRLNLNGNIENILAEHLVWFQLCRAAPCGQEMLAERHFTVWAQEVRALRAQHGSSDGMVAAIHAWMEKTAPEAGAAGEDLKKNAVLWRGETDSLGGDFATANIYALGFLAARRLGKPADQADAFNRTGALVAGHGWIGGRCIDFRRIAAVMDAEPTVELCTQ